MKLHVIVVRNRQTSTHFREQRTLRVCSIRTLLAWAEMGGCRSSPSNTAQHMSKMANGGLVMVMQDLLLKWRTTNTRCIGHSVKTFGWSPLSGACQWTSFHRGSAKKISDVPRVSVLLIAPTITLTMNIYLSARNRAAETHLCHRPLAFLQGRVLSPENNICFVVSQLWDSHITCLRSLTKSECTHHIFSMT